MKKHFLFSVLLSFLCAVPAWAWDNMYLIGTATDAGWTLENAVVMTKINEAEFEWSGKLQAGELKFLTRKDWWQMYGPAHNGYSYFKSENKKTSYNKLVQRSTYDLQFFATDGVSTEYINDYKFEIDRAGYYTLRVNTNTGKITTFPRKIYPVGDGCEVGWDDKSSLALVETGFASEVYEGDLTIKTSGELKFLNQQEFGQYQYGPTTSAEQISGIGVYSIEGRWEKNSEGVSEDYKYTITSPEDKYHIVADVRNGHGNVLKISKNIIFQFKMDAQAKAAWGNMPVVIRYWMNYKDADDESAYDHAFYQTLTADADGVYTAAIHAVAPVKFIIQTCLDNHGEWCGNGAHWTNEMTNSDNGYTADQKFQMVYENGHVLKATDAFEEEQDTRTIRSHKGYASFAWTNGFAVPEGVDAYVGAWKNGDIELSRIADGIVPAYAGVILYDTQMRDMYDVTATSENAAAYNTMTNDLQGAATADMARDETVMTYVLGDIDNVVAFYEYRGGYMPQYKAYLVAPEAQSAVQKVRIRFAQEVTTLLPDETAETGGPIYDVTGRVYPTQDIRELPQGVYFRNRTKMVVLK